MPEFDANLLYQIISSANATVLISMRGTCDERAAARSARALKSITDYPWGLPPQALRCHRLRRLKMLRKQFDPLRNEKIWVMTSPNGRVSVPGYGEELQCSNPSLRPV